MITIPTVAELRDQIITDIEAAIGQSVPILPRAVWRVLAIAIAGVLALVYRLASWTARQIFTATADDASLILRGQEYGLTRIPATKWIGTGTATGTNGSVIPAGTLFQLSGVVYHTTAAATIAGGVATLAMESLESGDDVDLDIADTVTLVTPIAGVDADVMIASATQSGEDAEDMEVFRARVAYRQAARPQGGAIPDWVGWATEVAGIAEAIVERPAAGSIAIYPLTDDADPANRIPDAAKLTEVETYVSDQTRAPIRAAEITVAAATELDFDVDIADLDPDTTATRAAIEAAIQAYLYERRPRQFSDQANPLDVVSAGEITSRAITAGALVATVTLKDAGGTPITSYTLDYDELAVLRTLSWV
jgi:uncharacterized phage protein gp47/JayE